MKCGLLGRNLRHSYSPAIHSKLGCYQYELFEREPEELEDFLHGGDFTGLNVTIPYKKAVIPYLDELTETAMKLGAVNTVIRQKDGKLVGHNTDDYGFCYMMLESKLNPSGKKCLILGSGGACATVRGVLEDMGAEPVIISRTGADNYQNLHLHSDASILVNTTPVGMYPNAGQSPVDLSLFPNLEGVLDLIYNPAKTQLIMDAQMRNIPAWNGLSMLVAQAKESAAFFTNTSIEDGKIKEVVRFLKKKSENIILIGMPGCGKSTIGSALADMTGKAFIDIDTEIEKEAGMSIPCIFSKYAEEGFRRLETKMLAKYGQESGLIIATGGGCVTTESNRTLLRQNGLIVWLQRHLSLLPTIGRPLSQSQNLEQMYIRRKPLYESFADMTVDNNGSIDDTLRCILTALEEDT